MLCFKLNHYFAYILRQRSGFSLENFEILLVFGGRVFAFAGRDALTAPSVPDLRRAVVSPPYGWCGVFNAVGKCGAPSRRALRWCAVRTQSINVGAATSRPRHHQWSPLRTHCRNAAEILRRAVGRPGVRPLRVVRRILLTAHIIPLRAFPGRSKEGPAGPSWPLRRGLQRGTQSEGFPFVALFFPYSFRAYEKNRAAGGFYLVSVKHSMRSG